VIKGMMENSDCWPVSR